MKAIPLLQLPTELPLPFDVFICSASFEERSICIVRHVGASVANETIVCVPDHYDASVSVRLNEMSEILTGNTRIVQVSRLDPLITADNLDQTLFNLPDSGEDARRILVDITTFTHEALLILLRLLIKLGALTPLQITWIYTGAKEYSIGATGKNKWLSRGVQEVRSVLGYPGAPALSTVNTLIILAGFESNRAEAIIQAYGPERIIVGHGVKGSSQMPAHADLNRSFMAQLLVKYPEIEDFVFPLDDPLEVRNILLEHASRFPDTNIVVAPMNNKVSTLGVGVAAYEDPDVQLCYAVAADYNVEKYSTPDDVCYAFELPGELFRPSEQESEQDTTPNAQ